MILDRCSIRSTDLDVKSQIHNIATKMDSPIPHNGIKQGKPENAMSNYGDLASPNGTIAPLPENVKGQFSLSEDINSIEDIRNAYKDKTDYLFISEKRDGTISIDNMVVKKNFRNQGVGTQILNDVIAYADKNGKTITLTPTSEFGTKAKLTKWYKANGFVENKGRNADYRLSDTMYRLPNQIKSATNENPTDSPDIRYSLSNVEAIVNKLTGEEISENTYKVLNKLATGEAVSFSEIEALKEVQEGKLKMLDFRDDFLAQHPQFKILRSEDVGTHLIDTSEREQLRKNILQKRLAEGSFAGVDNGGKELYNGNVEKGKRLDIVIGLPASGKFSAIVNPLSEFYKSVVIDSDIIKQELPEYNGGWGSSLVHEESSGINFDLFCETTRTGNNIVLPIVGAKISSVERYLNIAKAQGYSVYLHLNELPNSKAIGRMLGRYFNTGRFIDPADVAKYGSKPTEVYEMMKGRGEISGYSRWNNDVARGQRPTHTEISGGDEVYGAYSDSWGTGRRTEGERVLGANSQRANANLGDGVERPRIGLEGNAPRRQYSLGSIGNPAVVRLNPKTEEALTKSGVVSLELVDSSDNSSAFSVALNEARASDKENGWAVTPKSAEELVKDNVRTIMTSDRKAGLDFVLVGHFDWNKQSARVIEKCGFQYIKTRPYETRRGTTETALEYIRYANCEI